MKLLNGGKIFYQEVIIKFKQFPGVERLVSYLKSQMFHFKKSVNHSFF